MGAVAGGVLWATVGVSVATIASVTVIYVASARAARVEPNPEKQLELWKTAQQKIMAAVCAVPIYQNLQLWAWKSDLDLGVDVKGSLNLSPPVTELAHFK